MTTLVARRAATLSLCALLSVFLAAPASAQQSASAGSVAGRVVDAQSGEPLAAARARLVEAHREQIIHQDGRFSFTNVPAASYTLVVQRLGYRPSTQTVVVGAGAETELDIRLTPAPVQLTAAVVTGTLTERPRDEVLSPTSVVADAELDRRLQGTLGQTLQAQPGVTASSIGPATARPVIRGLTGDRIVILEDGQRPGDMSSMSSDHAVAIEPMTARQIEVVRGPMSLLYGSSALGGVVNVVRDEVPTSLPDDLHATATVQGNSVNSGGAAALLATTSTGNFAWRAEGSLRAAGNTKTPVGELLNTEVRTYNASAGGGYVGNHARAGASVRYYQNEYGIPGGFVGGHPAGVDVEMQRLTSRLEGERHFVDAALSSLGSTIQYTHYYHAELERSGAIGTEFAQDVVAGDALARHEKLGPFTLGAFGVRGQFRDITTGGSLRTPSTRDVQGAAYMVEEIAFNGTRLQFGARYDLARYEPQEQATVDVGGERIPVAPRTFGSVSGSIGVLQTLRPGIRAGANLSRAYRTPDFNELYSNGPHLANNTFEVGDPRLGQETGIGIDVYLRFTTEKVRAEIATFRNQLNGFIYPSSRGRAELGPQGGRPKFQYTNSDAVLAGADGSLEVELTQRVVFSSTVSSVFARFISPLSPIPIIEGADTTFREASKFPPLMPPVQGRSELRYEAPRFFAGAGVRVAGKQNRLGDFEEPTAGYVVSNIDGGVRLLHGHRLQTITLRVDNLFNREYRDHLSRVKEIMPEPGRDVSLVYRVQF